MKRAKHTLSHYRMHTANMGELVPIQCVPVLPGDTFQGSTSVLIRVSPLNTPVMHPCTARIHHWFVPNRIIMAEWEDFITGGADGDNADTPPTIASTATKKSLLTYLGVPPIAGSNVNELPVRATNLIWNQRYRDQDIATARLEDDITIPNIAWEKDDLTTARPWTQKGTAVTVPIGEKAPIMHEMTVSGSNARWQKGTDVTKSSPLWSHGTDRIVQYETGQDSSIGANIFADLSQATGVNVNDIRESFAKQRYMEARARYGSRFVEYLRYLGITPSDARLQEPEYIGGGNGRLSFSEVLQTAGTTDGSGDGVGDLYGHGIAGLRTPRFRKFFEEHGYLISMLSVRPKSVYLNGVQRDFLKQTKEDYFQKELAHLGQQGVKKGQVYLDPADPHAEWGFQDRYDEYRKHPSFVGQDFRDTLNSWHLARDLPVGTVLNEDFIKCVPSKRIFQVQTDDVLWIMVNNRLVARRMVPKRANPRIM